MRIAWTSDLHVDQNRQAAKLVAARMELLRPDLAVIAGDVSHVLPALEEALATIAAGARAGGALATLFVAGNHDLWVDPRAGGDSATKLRRDLPAACGRAGVQMLGAPGAAPPVFARAGAEPVGFVGVPGWYDYSLRSAWLDAEVTLADYARKRRGRLVWQDLNFFRWPRAAAGGSGDARGNGANDGANGGATGGANGGANGGATGGANDGANGGASGGATRDANDGANGGSALESDEGVARLMEADLAAQLAALRGRVRRAVAVTHFLPFRELCATRQHPLWDFLNAYMGSAALGEVIRGAPEVVLSLCGHTHLRREARVGRPGGGVLLAATSPLGYPRERDGTLEERVADRVRVVDLDGL